MIPFNRATIAPRQLDYVRQAFEGFHVSGDGPFGRRAEKALAEELGAKRVLLTTSCTHALEMSALLLDIQPGDEVIVPSFTFVSTVNAFVLRGARPVFIDVRDDTFNLDERLLEAKITPRTKAIVPVHYAGIGCEMDVIGAIAAEHGVRIVEDNAHGLFGRYGDKPLGSFGALATQSFHETKNLSCGEGGAIVINDEALIDRAEVLREKGTNRSRFFRGQVDKYTWVDVGSSWVMSDALAAVLVAQLEARTMIQETRRRICERYAGELGDWAGTNGVRLPFTPTRRTSPHHMFYVVLPDLARRTAFIEHLAKDDIKAVFHYQPLHRSPMAASSDDCPVTDRVADTLVRLPLYVNLSESDQFRVIESVRRFTT